MINISWTVVYWYSDNKATGGSDTFKTLKEAKSFAKACFESRQGDSKSVYIKLNLGLCFTVKSLIGGK